MKRIDAIGILMNLIKELEKINQGKAAIRADNVNGLDVEYCAFVGFDTALDAKNSKNITFNKNLVDNRSKRLEVLNLIEQFLSEANKPKSQYNKAFHVKIKDEILKRWPEIVGTGVVVALVSLIRS